MLRDLAQCPADVYDLVIIGGGINGAALANLAAREGLKTVLFEKNDFASGTSSKSTKLIHGGIRYLENFEFGLVRESLLERYIQLKNAPHLVKPLPFLVPVYKGDRRPLWMMKLGVFLYDFLSGKYKMGESRSLSAEDVINLEPALARENLIGGVMYFDSQMDDARLVLENVLSAKEQGAQVFNYAEVVSFVQRNGKTVGVQVRNVFNDKTAAIHAKNIVCAAGPWTNGILKMERKDAKERLRTTKGIHIVYPGLISRQAVVISSKEDNRIFFVIPWRGNSLIGTTDTDYTGSPDNVVAASEDIDYLLKEAARVFPKISFGKDNIIATFAGLRPLVKDKGHPSQISRRHVIEKSKSGVIYVLGGKFTTYRRIVIDVMDQITGKNRQRESFDYPLYGSGPVQETPKEVSQGYNVSLETAGFLMGLYGRRYREVLDLTKEDVSLALPICDCSPVIGAQVVYALQKELARQPEDIFARRLSLGYYPCRTRQCWRTIVKIAALDKRTSDDIVG